MTINKYHIFLIQSFIKPNYFCLHFKIYILIGVNNSFMAHKFFFLGLISFLTLIGCQSEEKSNSIQTKEEISESIEEEGEEGEGEKGNNLKILSPYEKAIKNFPVNMHFPKELKVSDKDNMTIRAIESKFPHGKYFLCSYSLINEEGNEDIFAITFDFDGNMLDKAFLYTNPDSLHYDFNFIKTYDFKLNLANSNYPNVDESLSELVFHISNEGQVNKNTDLLPDSIRFKNFKIYADSLKEIILSSSSSFHYINYSFSGIMGSNHKNWLFDSNFDQKYYYDNGGEEGGVEYETIQLWKENQIEFSYVYYREGNFVTYTIINNKENEHLIFKPYETEKYSYDKQEITIVSYKSIFETLPSLKFNCVDTVCTAHISETVEDPYSDSDGSDDYSVTMDNFVYSQLFQ